MILSQIPDIMVKAYRKIGLSDKEILIRLKEYKTKLCLK